MTKENESVKDLIHISSLYDIKPTYTEKEIKIFNKTDDRFKKLSDVTEVLQKKIFVYDKPVLMFSRKFYRPVTSMATGHEKLLEVSEKVAFSFASLYKKFMTNEHVYNMGRWTTPLVNWFWYKFLKHNDKDKMPIFEHGTHFMYALQGGGKSSLLFNIAETIRLKTGKGVYVNTEFENPKYDPINKYWFKYHQNFNETEYWGLEVGEDNLGNPVYSSTQLMQFDTNFAKCIIIDELLSTFNQRENKNKDYNNVFIGMMKSIAHQRHQGIDWIYFASQIDTTDVQLSKIFKFVHEVKVVLDVPYWDWYMTGSMQRNIIGWWVTTFYKSDKDPKKILSKKYFIPRIFNPEDFNTLNMAYLYERLPKKKVEYERGKA